jgi:hypothetical protein
MINASFGSMEFISGFVFFRCAAPGTVVYLRLAFIDLRAAANQMKRPAEASPVLLVGRSLSCRELQ